MQLITAGYVTTTGVSFAVKDKNTTAEIATESRYERLITHYKIPKRQRVFPYRKYFVKFAILNFS
jgi:hypothetical protein